MRLIQKIAQAQVLQHYGLHKLARTKFLELAEKGLLSAKDKARLGITQKFTEATGKRKNRMVQNLRERLYGAKTDLTRRQLANNQAIGQMTGDAIVARHGTAVSKSPMGTAGNVMGNIFVDKDLTKNLNKAVTPIGGRPPKNPESAMGNIRRSVIDHELAEATMGAGAANWARQQGQHERAAFLSPRNASELKAGQARLSRMKNNFAKKINLLPPGTEHAYEAKPYASHYGPAAAIAETQRTFRDPAASRYMAKLRESDPGDAYTQRKMKQFGHTPAYPMPLGGKQHFALDNAVANMPEAKLGPQAKQLRALTPGAQLPKGTKAELEQGLKQIESLLQEGLIDPATAEGMRNRTQELIQLAEKSEGIRQRPYADRQEARRRHMALFAAPRNDANPGRRI